VEDSKKLIKWKNTGMNSREDMNAFNPVLTIGDPIAEVLMLHKGLTELEVIEEFKKPLKNGRHRH